MLIAFGAIATANAAQEGHYISTPANQKITCTPGEVIDIETEELQYQGGAIFYYGERIPVTNNHATYSVNVSGQGIERNMQLEIIINNNTINLKAQTEETKIGAGIVEICNGTALFVKS